MVKLGSLPSVTERTFSSFGSTAKISFKPSEKSGKASFKGMTPFSPTTTPTPELPSLL
jgi:hypothetical protein